MTHHRIGLLFLGVSTVFGCSRGQVGTSDEAITSLSGEGSGDGKATLNLAHEAYLAGNWIELGERIREVLLDARATNIVRENAFELLDKAYEAQNGSLPSSFVLPNGVIGMQYFQGRAWHGRAPMFRAGFWMRAKSSSRVRELTVTRLPSEKVLDLGSSLGTLEVQHVMEGYDDIVLRRPVGAALSDGVFSVRVALDDAAPVEGWFIANTLTPSSTPDVKAPEPSGNVPPGHPAVTWVPFRSPEYAPYERRTVNVFVSRDEKMVWNFWTGQPGEMGEVHIGAEAGAPSTSLTPGEYWLTVTSGERRSFGPIELERSSQTGRPFRVLL